MSDNGNGWEVLPSVREERLPLAVDDEHVRGGGEDAAAHRERVSLPLERLDERVHLVRRPAGARAFPYEHAVLPNGAERGPRKGDPVWLLRVAAEDRDPELLRALV